MKGWLSSIWQRATRDDLVARALRRGDIDAIDRLLVNGTDPVVLYARIRATLTRNGILRAPAKGYRASIAYLEDYINAIATVPGDHVPRHHGWQMDFKQKRKPKC